MLMLRNVVNIPPPAHQECQSFNVCYTLS
jgi:hypothetical protein